jgi:hypothetical protein
MNNINWIIREPMDDGDIRTYFPDAKIMVYSDLKHYSTIDTLLPAPIDYVFLLYETSRNSGHWVCVFKHADTLSYFDSYGGAVDNPLQWTSTSMRKVLGEDRAYLTDLFDASDYNVFYNPIDYQEKKVDISTCGAHCCFFIQNALKGLNLHQYYLLMKALKREHNL